MDKFIARLVVAVAIISVALGYDSTVLVFTCANTSDY
jgi:hypothetical protein